MLALSRLQLLRLWRRCRRFRRLRKQHANLAVHLQIFSRDSPGSVATESDDEEVEDEDEDHDNAAVPTKALPCAHAADVWAAVSSGAAHRDDHGYGRIPACWFPLNCPYNYLHEIHRFHADEATLRGTDSDSRRLRTTWCYDHPDLVCFLHALRVELLVRMVLPAIVPTSPTQPFHFLVRTFGSLEALETFYTF